MFFDLSPRLALLGDKNTQLIETYQTVREFPDEVFDRVMAIPRKREIYYKQRGLDVRRLSEKDRAARFIFLNRNCFNGIYRTNLKGEFNVPFSDYRVGAFVTREEFLAAAGLLQSADLRASDFGRTLQHVGRGDFVYLDPPYAVESRRVFREYGKRIFSTADLNRLAGHLDRIAARGAAFVFSYADCRESRHIAARWICHRTTVRRHVAGFSGFRKSSSELVITNVAHDGVRDSPFRRA